MKYKVIGWTYYEDTEILTKDDKIGFAERNAIIDDIKKHKYLFSGWHHQESWNGVVPVLNDGKKRCFSQRGWGGVMAEAYGYTDDYDYAAFSFSQSIPADELHFAKDDFDINKFIPQFIENENFNVEVSDELFELAKSSNPFYLEDLDELRYIDEDDSITLFNKTNSLTFIVKNVDRNKTEIGLKNANKLIKGKYKIIISHKPESERRIPKLPIIVTRSNAFDLFRESMDIYNYDVIEELFNCFNLEYFLSILPCENSTSSLIRFVKEYVNNSYKAAIIIQLLQYLDNYELYKEIANKTLESNKNIYISFINYYLEKDINMDYEVLYFVNSLKSGRYFSYDSIDILLKAISLKPNNKSLRKKYYVAIRYTNHEGLAIMAGANLYKYLRKQDIYLIQLDKYRSYNERQIIKIVEYLTYPNNKVNKDSYPLRLPKIYEIDETIIAEGVEAYQKYISEHFNIDSIIKDIIYHGIEQKCFEMDNCLFGIEDAAKYLLALDMLTDYKYNLKEYAINKYSNSSDFTKELENIYKKQKVIICLEDIKSLLDIKKKE